MKKLFFLLLPFLLISSEVDDIKTSMQLDYLENTKNIELIKKENMFTVKQNLLYYKTINQKAFQYYDDFLKKSWGKDNVKLSNKMEFVQYSKDLKSRESIHFEKGEVIVSIITDENVKVEPDAFEKKIQMLKEQTVTSSLKKDPVAQLIKKYMIKKKIIEPINENIDKSKILDDLLEEKRITNKDVQEKIIIIANGTKKKISTVVVQMVPEHLKKRATKYKSIVKKYAKKYKLKVSQIYATIQAESYFNPLARSHVPAFGLMQIVPSTAGIDAYYMISGKRKILSPAYLYHPINNIELGSQYIQIIQTRYLKGIKNKQSLFYCNSTAYNAGIGTLVKSFTGSKRKRKEAIKIINTMTPDEVYTHLRTSKRLNYEARTYVKKLKKYANHYTQWDS